MRKVVFFLICSLLTRTYRILLGEGDGLLHLESVTLCLVANDKALGSKACATTYIRV